MGLSVDVDVGGVEFGFRGDESLDGLEEGGIVADETGVSCDEEDEMIRAGVGGGIIVGAE